MYGRLIVDTLAIVERINEARASLRAAVRIAPGRLAIEGDVESANALLEEARSIVDRDPERARKTVEEAVALLRSEETRLIAEHPRALGDAIAGLSRISWN
jgi:hypothetical protein